MTILTILAGFALLIAGAEALVRVLPGWLRPSEFLR